MSCKGCSDPYQLKSYLEQLAGAGLDIAQCLTGKHTNEAILKHRLEQCKECKRVDSKGQLLYRTFMEKYHTCGEFRLTNPLRDVKKNGCGCVLEVKAAGNKQRCIHYRW